jgi:hypothetical protein
LGVFFSNVEEILPQKVASHSGCVAVKRNEPGKKGINQLIEKARKNRITQFGLSRNPNTHWPLQGCQIFWHNIPNRKNNPKYTNVRKLPN